MKALGNDYKNAKANTGDFTRLPAGGYICEITAVEDKPDKEYLNITFDIAVGEFKGFYSDEWGKAHPYAHSFVRSYKKTGDEKKDARIMGMFKGFLKAIDDSNGTHLEQMPETGLDEDLLVGKKVGLVIGYEEYESDRGEIRERTRVQAIRTMEDIAKGNYKVPEVKRITPSAPAPIDGFLNINPDDVPF